MKVGLVINPVAGMGGSVGLKGTDSEAVLTEAVHRGAKPIAERRASEALRAAGDLKGYQFFTAGGPMGGDLLSRYDVSMTVVHAPADSTTEEDTKRTAKALVDAGVDVIVFVGGDGTARDIHDAVGEGVPVIGVPSGVKMHSGVFANTPRDAGVLLRRMRVETLPSKKAEVMDVDEGEVRQGRMSAKLYGHMLTPEDPGLIQPFKLILGGGSEEEHKEAIAQYMSESMHRGVLYVLGPGSTVEALGRKLGIDKTLLGVDLVLDGKLVAKDVDERTVLSHLDKHPEARIVVSPIGAQGFIFGRGNQQISPQVIKRVGIRKVVILATPSKMKETRALKVDTGDKELDERLRGYGKVVIGYGKQLVAPIS